jgi:hypothetical protein
MNKASGTWISKLFSGKKEGEPALDPVEQRNSKTKNEEETLQRLLARTKVFVRSTQPSRTKEKDPWLGSMARLMACCGYESFQPVEDRQMERARTLWKGMQFALPCVQPPPKLTPAAKAITMDPKSVLRRFQSEFSAREMEDLSSIPDEPAMIDVEEVGSRFQIVASLLSSLDNQSICDQHIFAVHHQQAVEFQDLYYVFEREVDIFPGEFISKKPDPNVVYHTCRVQNTEFKIDASLPPLLQQKVLRPISVQKMEGHEKCWYNFIVVC